MGCLKFIHDDYESFHLDLIILKRGDPESTCTGYTGVYIGENINLHHRETLQDCNILAEQNTVYI